MSLYVRCAVLVSLSLSLLAAPGLARDEAALKKSLAYLEKIDDVAWVEFDSNNVYVGFRSKPGDLAIIVNAAAVGGNNAYGFGVHVWAISSEHKGWRPGSGPYLCEATARYGKLNNPCKWPR